MVGTTRSRVNHLMSNFKRLGFLEKHDGLLQVNPARLKDGSAALPALTKNRS